MAARIRICRSINCESGRFAARTWLAIFQRGETQALALATLAPIEEAQMIDAYGGGEQSKRFILLNNFPPSAWARLGGPARRRREIGHRRAG